MSEELLDVLQRHTPFQKCHSHRMAQYMRVHPLGDVSLLGGFLHQLLDAPGRVVRVPYAFKQVARGAIPKVGAQFLRQRRVAAAALR